MSDELLGLIRLRCYFKTPCLCLNQVVLREKCVVVNMKQYLDSDNPDGAKTCCLSGQDSGIVP